MPGLVVVDLAAADDATALAVQKLLADRRPTWTCASRSPRPLRAAVMRTPGRTERASS
ncbi:DUF6207 family protein [Streptomyces mirabilis]|uniref:DUF6207 family protein n=1 Tax=Streptomyces TaxID=1883 RepID=UPI0029B65432|nr:DUF6207 family protein [Streptomyces sp. AK02-04a]MDX3762432.1 DUF6207 family protein [Streptomyces sp. AK02-04a]